MFYITDSMLESWREMDKPKATTMDIARIEGEIHFPLSDSYIEFVTLYGFVIFGEDEDHRYHFDYEIDFPDRKEIREGNIAFLHKPDQIIMAYNNMTIAEFEDDETLPAIPPNYLPIGNDMGQGQILLELGENAGRVWYWPEREWAWGTEGNTWLGFVADDFYGFINKLRP